MCKATGRHGRAPDDGWGYLHGSGYVTLYCGGCYTPHSIVPLLDYFNRAEVRAEVAGLAD